MYSLKNILKKIWQLIKTFSQNQCFELASCEEDMGKKNQHDALITGAFSGRSILGRGTHGIRGCGK